MITGQTQGIVANISKRFPEKHVVWLPNGVTPEVFEGVDTENDWKYRNGFTNSDFFIFYGGIIGYAQGLDLLLDTARELKEFVGQAIHFCIFGDGPEKEKLLQRKERENIQTVHFFDTLPRKELLGVLRSCNCCVVPLKKLDLFQGAIPSKIFEACASEKPILLGVDGEAKNIFVDEARAGVYFEPENRYQLIDGIKYLASNPESAELMGKRGKEYVFKNFNRQFIAYRLVDDLKLLV
jgi:glycosyltransferase involved in cell wall biosynthesis